jgi:dihydrofolate synthase / folylpolyglutamate synthase
MNYGECRRYLQEILDSGVKFGLDNVRTVLTALGDPHLTFPSVLVAGTNGKGSVCAMLARILSRHGFRTGLYTSPHLVEMEERIRVGDDPVSRREFCRLLSCLKAAILELVASGKLETPPTYFEVLTILALLYFREKKVDIAVLEVGMGGRLDATNVVTPLVSVITTVGLDHQEYLGPKLTDIALEKAGIIKPGVPVVCGPARGAVRRIIERRAREVGAPVRRVFDEPGALKTQKRKGAFRFSFCFEGKDYVFSPRLAGEHQGGNAALAIAAGVEIGRRWRPLKKSGIIQGVREARWPGRLETVRLRPRVVLDGAHNDAGARVAATYARDFLPRPRTLVFAVMKDKNIRRVTSLLFPIAETIILTSVPMPRAASPELVFSLAPARKKGVFLESDPKRAVKKALEMTPAGGSVLITGSLFLVGEMKRLFPSWRRERAG